MRTERRCVANLSFSEKGWNMAKLKTETRTIHNAGRLKVIGEFHSFKNKATVAWESKWSEICTMFSSTTAV